VQHQARQAPGRAGKGWLAISASALLLPEMLAALLGPDKTCESSVSCEQKSEKEHDSYNLKAILVMKGILQVLHRQIFLGAMGEFESIPP
jgi:hypothetical protein